VPELVRSAPAPYVEIHPVLADRLGIADADLVQLDTGRGRGVVRARLTDADLELAHVVAADAPRGALTDLAEAVDHLLAAPVAEGQIITPAALTTAHAVTSRGRVVAPLRLADADLAALLRPGDEVDVIAADPQSEQADVVARAVRVVTVPRADDPDESSETTAGTLILIEVDPGTARVLARAAVSATLTVIWR